MNIGVPIGKKCSGKASAYWEFVKRKGAEKFRREHRRLYSEHSIADRNIMSEYFTALSPSEREFFNQLAQELNRNKDDILERRKNGATARRNAQHANPRGYLERKETHRMAIENESMKNERCIAIPGAMGYKIPVFNSEVAKEREKYKKLLENWNNFQLLNISHNPYLRAEQEFIILSITPITCDYEYLLHQITSFPAEIGAISFNIKDGIVKSKSIFVEFPFDWFYDGQDPKANEESRKKATTDLGIPEKGHPNGVTPLKAFKFVTSLLGKSKKLFIDAYNIRNTLNSLRCLATYVGPNALATFSKEIAPIATSIQDFAHVMVKGLGETQLSNVEGIFQNKKLRPIKSLPCKFHETADLAKANFCPQSNNIRLIHSLYQCLKLSEMKEFTFVDSIHELCSEETMDMSFPRDFEVTEELRQSMIDESPVNESQFVHDDFAVENFFEDDDIDDMNDPVFEQVWNTMRTRITPSVSRNQRQLAQGNDAGFDHASGSQNHINVPQEVKTIRKCTYAHKSDRRIPRIHDALDNNEANDVELASLKLHFNDAKKRGYHFAIREFEGKC